MKSFVLQTHGDISKVVAYLNALKTDGTYMVEVKKAHGRRKLIQNNLYWFWLGIISKDTGYTVNELHVAFRKKFLHAERIEAFGEVWEELVSTTKLTVKEFAEYLTEIETLAAEIGIALPTRDDEYFEAVYGARRRA